MYRKCGKSNTGEPLHRPGLPTIWAWITREEMAPGIHDHGPIPKTKVHTYYLHTLHAGMAYEELMAYTCTLNTNKHMSWHIVAVSRATACRGGFLFFLFFSFGKKYSSPSFAMDDQRPFRFSLRFSTV